MRFSCRSRSLLAAAQRVLLQLGLRVQGLVKSQLQQGVFFPTVAILAEAFDSGGGIGTLRLCNDCAIVCTMARIFMCVVALLTSFCFVVPRPEHPRFDSNQFRLRETDKQYKIIQAVRTADGILFWLTHPAEEFG